MPAKLHEYDAYLSELAKLLNLATTDKQLFATIVNAPFSNKLQAAKLGLGIVVLLRVNQQTQTIDRIALSDTELAKETQRVSVKPFASIGIPLSQSENIIAAAIDSKEFQKTDDWQYLFNPILSPEEARFNQAAGGIGCSVVYPLSSRDGGALIFSYYQSPKEIQASHHMFMDQYSRLVASALGAPSSPSI